ncbi:uncharacterized protein TNCV_266661 [Trichonephila clavipes]|nr:uncharacterized protein TNCV_266661 [Trichonephila clavipes]
MDGSRDNYYRSGSGIYIKSQDHILRIQRRSPDGCSVFRSELTAIDETLGSHASLRRRGSSESVQEFAARINKLGTQIFQSGNSAQNTAVRNANDQLLQSRFISGFRNDIRRFVLARDPINLDESINAALIEEQNVKINQIANDERSGLSPSQTETSVISALTNKLQEINLRVERLQEASSVTVRKTGGDPFGRRETVFRCFYCGFQGHRQADCRKRRIDEHRANYQPPSEGRRGRIFCFSSPKHSFFRSETCPFPRIGFSR